MVYCILLYDRHVSPGFIVSYRLVGLYHHAAVPDMDQPDYQKIQPAYIVLITSLT